MARSVRESSQPSTPERVRREELIRSAPRRRDFPRREALQRLQQKEARWAPLAYGVFFVGVLTIFCVTYTSYAFSKYRGVILPGVYVDKTSLNGLSSRQAYRRIDGKLAAIYGVPLQLQFGSHVWNPKRNQIGLQYNIQGTVNEAESIGRNGAFVSNLIDRLPLHPSHTVPLLYRLNERRLRFYLGHVIAPVVFQRSANAGLAINHKTWTVTLLRSKAGTQLDVANSEQSAHDAFGSLSKQTRTLQILHLTPVITDDDARRVQSRVEAFLAHPPVMQVGKRIIVGSRYSFAQMIHFSTHVNRRKAAIRMAVDPVAVRAYVDWLASTVNRKPRNAQLEFSANSVRQVTASRMGRTLNSDVAYSKLLQSVTALRPTSRLRFPVSVIRPPFDATNPASLGISTMLAAGTSSFSGAGKVRTDAISTIAGALNNVVLTPNENISFNQLVQTSAGWANSVFADEEASSGGQPIPGSGGAMQQVATTFLRALYKAGLQSTERHAHRFRLPWYEPPYGFDAVVNPARNWDLTFHNSTGRYLLLQTRFEPIQQTVSVYVYGPHLGWKVAVETFGHITRIIKHGPPVERVDPSLAPDQRQQVAWPADGGTTTLQRTITKPNGNVSVDEIDSVYDPRAAVIAIGVAAPTSTPTPTAVPTKKPGAIPVKTPGSTATLTPSPTPADVVVPTETPSH